MHSADRGEAWVAGQFVLLGAVVVGSFFGGSWPWPVRLFGGVLLFLGALFALAAARGLGPALTPLPRPSGKGELVVSGPYAVVRHPIYSGVATAAVGFSVLVSSWWSLGASLLLVVFFHFKAVREEKWLVAHYPGYPEYMARVRRRLIPWLT
ncbi:MAG: methyltransferase family protein [Gaiellaceae bacterium]